MQNESEATSKRLPSHMRAASLPICAAVVLNCLIPYTVMAQSAPLPGTSPEGSVNGSTGNIPVQNAEPFNVLPLNSVGSAPAQTQQPPTVAPAALTNPQLVPPHLMPANVPAVTSSSSTRLPRITTAPLPQQTMPTQLIQAPPSTPVQTAVPAQQVTPNPYAAQTPTQSRFTPPPGAPAAIANFSPTGSVTASAANFPAQGTLAPMSAPAAAPPTPPASAGVTAPTYAPTVTAPIAAPVAAPVVPPIGEAPATPLQPAPVNFSVATFRSQTARLPQNSQPWEQIQKTATEDIYTGKYGEAERLLKLAIVKSSAFGESDIRYAKSLDELGRLYSIRARFMEAEPLLEQALRVKEHVMDMTSGAIIPSMGTVVTFYLEHGTAEKADALSDQMLSFIEGKLMECRNAPTGPVKVKKGQPLTAWAGTAAPTMRDPVIEWAITCDGIGNLYRLKAKYDLAERCYKAALDVKETVLGKEHLSLANSYDSLGTIYMDRNQDQEAENFFRYAYEHTSRILEKNNPQVFSRLDKLAKCLIKEQKFEEAEQLYEKAQTFWAGEPSKNGSEARVAYSLGSLYIAEKKYELAEPVLKHAFELAEEYYGPSSISLVTYIQKYADAMHALGKDSEMVDLKAQASDIKGPVTQ